MCLATTRMNNKRLGLVYHIKNGWIFSIITSNVIEFLFHSQVVIIDILGIVKFNDKKQITIS